MKKCPRCGAEIDGGPCLCPECKTKLMDETNGPGYENYYDDVRPDDDGKSTNPKSNSIVAFRIGLIVFGLVLTVAAGIAILCLI